MREYGQTPYMVGCGSEEDGNDRDISLVEMQLGFHRLLERQLEHLKNI
jgi:hypothetical protein